MGDAGTSEAGPGSRRYGLELASYYRPAPWFTVDSELALSHARFKDAGDDDHIPGSIDTMWSGGITVGAAESFGSLRGRFFAPTPAGGERQRSSPNPASPSTPAPVTGKEIGKFPSIF